MARYSEPKQKRSITNQYGLFIVKTKDMCTYHRTFVEAAESYGLVYGNAPIAGIVGPAVTLPIVKAKPAITFDQAADVYEKSVEIYSKSVELMKQIKAQRAERQALSGEIKKSLSVKTIDPWQIAHEREAA